MKRQKRYNTTVVDEQKSKTSVSDQALCTSEDHAEEVSPSTKGGRSGGRRSKNEVEHDGPLPLRPMQKEAKLSEHAVAVCVNRMDCQEHSLLMQQIEKDDELSEIASCRGLLVKFVVRALSFSGNEENASIEVQSPEFADVGFLHRRIMKEKLQKDLVLLEPNKFRLRLLHSDRRIESETLNKHEYLFSLGFRAGGKYELEMLSDMETVPEVDRIQQESLVGFQSELGPLCTKNDDVRRYQDLLQGSSRAERRTSVNLRPNKRTSLFMDRGVPGPSAFRPVELDGANPISRLQSSRNQRAGKWTSEEIQYLIYGIRMYGRSAWTMIHKQFSGNGISEIRTPVDYKDKWRNLVKAANNMSQSSRASLSPELKDVILQLSNSSSEGTLPRNVENQQVTHDVNASIPGAFVPNREEHAPYPNPSPLNVEQLQRILQGRMQELSSQVQAIEQPPVGQDERRLTMLDMATAFERAGSDREMYGHQTRFSQTHFLNDVQMPSERMLPDH